MATLPRPASSGTATTATPSLARAYQLVTTLEEGFTRTLGYGVISGGLVTVTSGFGVRVANSSRFFAEGKVHTLSAVSDYNGIVETSTTVYLWGLITRTNGGDSLPAAEDTYTLTVSHNTSGTAPSALHFPLAVVKTDGSGVASINNGPEGKYLKVISPLWQGKTTIAATDGAVVAADEELVRAKLTVNGVVTINGTIWFVGG